MPGTGWRGESFLPVLLVAATLLPRSACVAEEPAEFVWDLGDAPCGSVARQFFTLPVSVLGAADIDGVAVTGLDVRVRWGTDPQTPDSLRVTLEVSVPTDPGDIRATVTLYPVRGAGKEVPIRMAGRAVAAGADPTALTSPSFQLHPELARSEPIQPPSNRSVILLGAGGAVLGLSLVLWYGIRLRRRLPTGRERTGAQ